MIDMMVMPSKVEFIAGLTAPSAESAIDALIPDHLGEFALRGFRVDPNDPSSEVRLDTSVQPPVLHLNRARTATVYGRLIAESDIFEPYGGYMPEIPHLATGIYSGPGSKLTIK